MGTAQEQTDRSEGQGGSRETVRSDGASGASPEEGVAYQGRPGAFGDGAARRVGGAGEETVPCATFEAVVEALVSGRVRRGVLPVVNVLAGGVGAALDLVAARGDVAVVGAVTVPVVLALIAPPGVGMEAVRRVRSHPVALAQCRGFFGAHPQIEAVADFDTAGAVEAVVAENRGVEAALAHIDAARVYGGCVLARAVQDHPANATRFLVLARTADAPPAPDASTDTAAVAVWTGPDAGLGAVLTALAAAGWRLAHIERRPAPELLPPDAAATGAAPPGRFVLELVGTGALPHVPDLVVRGAYAA